MNDERVAVALKRGDRAAAAREIADFIGRNPNIFGGADIFKVLLRSKRGSAFSGTVGVGPRCGRA
jgi:hypothetical protein